MQNRIYTSLHGGTREGSALDTARLIERDTKGGGESWPKDVFKRIVYDGRLGDRIEYSE